MKWLIITVGGSHQPIVIALEAIKPERVVFVCSKNMGNTKGSYTQIIGDGNVCIAKFGENPTLPNIPTQLNMAEEVYLPYMVQVEPDDIGHCYTCIQDKVREIRKMDESSDIYCDFTGGTKSMSSALVMAAIDDGDIKIRIVTGPRTNLIKIDDVSYIAPAKVKEIYLKRLENKLNILLLNHHYSACVESLTSFIADTEVETKWTDLRSVLIAMDAWDRFDYAEAHKYLGNQNSYPNWKSQLGLLAKLKESINTHSKSAPAYELPMDILANADRRAAQGRYEDAIARHYRAVELVGQIRLRSKYDINTSNVPCKMIPDSMSWKKNTEVEMKLGLMQSWELLSALDDEIKDMWGKWRCKLFDALQARNMNLGAHGVTPASRAMYEKDREKGMAEFARQAVIIFAGKKIETPNMPKCIEDIIKE